VVWTLTLQPESEGRALISCAARLHQVTITAVSFPRHRGAQLSANRRLSLLFTPVDGDSSNTMIMRSGAKRAFSADERS